MSIRKLLDSRITHDDVKTIIAALNLLKQQDDYFKRTKEENSLLRQCYQDSPQQLVERLQRIQKIATFHSDTDCWPSKENIYGGFVEDLFFLDELIDTIKLLPAELPEGKYYR
jgi:hypothetical protein